MARVAAMTRARAPRAQTSGEAKGSAARTSGRRKRRSKTKNAARRRTSAPQTERQVAKPEGPSLKSQAQLEIRLGHGARPLTAAEQAARLASARMERRIGRLLSRRVKLKFV
jgi:hypothetical protein